MIVGKRALPALALTAEGGPLPAQVALVAEPDDLLIAFERDDPETAEAAALATRARLPRARASTRPASRSCARSWPRPPTTCSGSSCTCSSSTAGCSRAARAETVHDSGASSFLYPFLGEQEHDLEAVVADVRASVLAKAAETAALREQTLAGNAAVLRAAAATLRAAFASGGRLLALGNGGSATDAMDVVADFHAPLGGGPARPAIDLTEDTGILTALANDIGPDAMFSRQLIAHARAGDVLLALSTSGTSGERDRGARGGAPARDAHDRDGRL